MKSIILLIFLSIVSFAGHAAVDFNPSAEGYLGLAGNGQIDGPYPPNLSDINNTYVGSLVGKIDHFQSDLSKAIEGRAFYEFDLSSLPSNGLESATFSFTVNAVPPPSTCFDFQGCPILTSINVLGYAGSGVISPPLFNTGDPLGTVNNIGTVTELGSTVTVDVTSFINDLLSSGGSFAGFNIVANSFNGILYVPNGLLTITQEPLAVSMDIKPDGFPNSINPKSRGVIPVALLTTTDNNKDILFDATTVDSTTARFGSTGTEAIPQHTAIEDVNNDGLADMVFQFPTQSTGILCGQNTAVLTGETMDAIKIIGTDSIVTVGC